MTIKKTRLLLAAVALFMATPMALAVTSPYNWGFNKVPTKNTSTHEYIVGTGWDFYYDDSDESRNAFPNFSTSTNTYGVNKTNAIKLLLSSGYTDLIVSPAVKGDVSIKVRKTSSSTTADSIAFYKVNKASDGTLTVAGQLTDVVVPTLTTSYQTVTIGSFDTDTYIGIQGQNVYIDDFSAGSADVDLAAGVTIASVANKNGTYVDADTAGNFTAKYTVSVKNTGDLDIAAGEDSIEVIDRATGKTVYTQSVASAIAMSKSVSVSVAMPLSLADYPAGETYYFDFKETLCGATYTKDTKGVTPVACEPQMNVVFVATKDALQTGSQVNFKLAQADVTKSYTIYNNGGAALEISEITLSDGYTSSLAAPLTINAHASSSMVITESGSTAGEKTGTLTIKSNDGDLALNMKGRIVEKDAFFYNVDDAGNSIPGYFVKEGSWSVHYNTTSLKIYEENTCSLQGGEGNTGKFVTPLLGFGTGDEMEFEVSKVDTSSNLKVYYSADRKNWTLAKEVTAGMMSDEGADKGTNTVYPFTHFVIDNIPTGNWYVGFVADNSLIDNLIGPSRISLDHDLYIASLVIPDKGSVNNALTATAKLTNTLDKAEDASGYTVTLHLGDECYSHTSTAIDAYGSSVFTFNYTPHAAGTYPAWVSFDFADGYKVVSDTVAVVVAQESSDRQIAVGESNAADYVAPVNTGVHYSQSETIYLASELNLREGATITGVTYRGADGVGSYGAAYKPVTTKLTFYLQNTDSASYSAPYVSSLTDSDAAVFSHECTIESSGQLGSYNSDISGYTFEQLGDKIVVTFDKPFTYTGKNLRVIVLSAIPSGDNVFNNYFEADSKTLNRCITRTASTETSLSSAAFYSAKLPVAHFSVNSEASILSGKVTAQQGGAAIEGATVTLKAGDVVYNATTDAAGAYSVSVYYDARDYEVAVEADGYYPAHATVNVAGAVIQDFALQDATGLYVSSSDIPATGEVNSVYTATATAKNYTNAEISSYTAKFYFNGEVVAVAEAVPVAAGAEAAYSFSFTPHAEAVAPAYVELALSDDNRYATDSMQVTISAESIGGAAQWGDSTGVSGSYAPTNWGDKNSQSQFYYTADQIGIPTGATLTRICFKGYSTRTNTYDANVNVWLKNVTDVPDLTTETDTTTANKVYSGQIHVEQQGSSSEPVIVMDLPLGDSFSYEGGSVLVIVHSYSSNYNTTYFVSNSGNTKQATYRSADIFNNMLTKSWNATAQPVAYIEYTNYVEVAGTVVEATTSSSAGVKQAAADVPVAGATVTYTSGDVQYQATTDADGKFSFQVGKPNLDYLVTAVAPGYKESTVEIAAAELATPVVIALEFDSSTGLADVQASGKIARKGVFTIDGRQLSAGSTTEGLEPGLYIVDGKKVIVKR